MRWRWVTGKKGSLGGRGRLTKRMINRHRARFKRGKGKAKEDGKDKTERESDFLRTQKTKKKKWVSQGRARIAFLQIFFLPQ